MTTKEQFDDLMATARMRVDEILYISNVKVQTLDQIASTLEYGIQYSNEDYVYDALVLLNDLLKERDEDG